MSPSRPGRLHRRRQLDLDGTGMVLHKSLPTIRPRISRRWHVRVSPNLLVASTQSGFKTVADLIAGEGEARRADFRVRGVGSSSHMAGERLRLAANIDVRHVPFRDQGLTR